MSRHSARPDHSRPVSALRPEPGTQPYSPCDWRGHSEGGDLESEFTQAVTGTIAGYVLTPFGRRCWIAGIADRNPAKRGYAERQAINAPLQGGAADIIKRAMVRLPAGLRAAGLRSRLLLQVHDELLFEAPEEEAETLAAIAKRTMEAAAQLAVPLLVETGTGRTWAEAH